MTKPPAIAPPMMELIYASNVRVPSLFCMTKMLAIFAAGPAMSRTRAAPGVRPFIIKATAMGMEPVAQTYIGMLMASTKSMDSHVLSAKIAKNSCGTKTVISPAMTRPITSHLPMSSIISTKA